MPESVVVVGRGSSLIGASSGERSPRIGPHPGGALARAGRGPVSGQPTGRTFAVGVDGGYGRHARAASLSPLFGSL